MANTEGMPDEFVESLMMAQGSSGSVVSTSVGNASNSNNGKTRKKGESQMNARQRLLQQRMEMPMAEGRPAAKVVRASRPTTTNTSTTKRVGKKIHTAATEAAEADAADELAELQQQSVTERTKEQTQTQPSSASQSSSPPPVVGEILERPVTNRGKATKPRIGKGKVSRFAQQQQMPMGGNNINGFPSVHVPLGTFVSKKKQTTPSPSVASSSYVSPPIVKSEKTTNQISTNKSSNNTDSIHQVSSKDAEGMLNQMTPDEIRQHQQELESALSPEMMAFLKRRGQNKNKQQQQQQIKSTISSNPTTLATNSPNIIEKLKRPTEADERTEKERLAKLMASVRTHQDLDTAYHAEMQQPHPLEQQEDDVIPGDDNTNQGSSTSSKNFILACDLLRSTSPRQALWATRVVSKELNRIVKENKPVSSLPIPMALPVSLRCLLDQSLSAGGVLHTYVLQSLYSLLLLYAVPDHKVHVFSSLPPLDADLFQAFCMEDAVPTPPLDTAYPGASAPKPLNIENASNDKGAAAYSTSSSSTSAEADGQAFRKDPMWTLLSKMHIIPRLAHLLVAVKNNVNGNEEELPPEAWIASCGILCMLSQRSPGAASAIVHHQTLLPCILDRSIHRMQNELSDSNYSETLEVTFAAMKLLCTIARQSRSTAQKLPIEDILPFLLCISPESNVLEFRLQQLALTLWRMLLRYGLGLPAFSTMLTFSARHLTLPYTQEYSLSIDFLSGFTQVLECAKIARSKRSPNNNEITNINSPLQPQHVEILSMASTYLSSAQQRALLQATTPTIRDPSSRHSESLSYRWNTARLKFLAAYWGLSGNESRDDSTQSNGGGGTINEEIKTEEMPMEDGLACLLVLGQWVAPGGIVSAACKSICSGASNCSRNDDETEHNKENEKEVEAAASSFVGAVASFLLTIEQSPTMHDGATSFMLQEQSRLTICRFLERVCAGIGPKMAFWEIHNDEKNSMARAGWINHFSFAISKLCFHAISTGILTSASDIEMARAFAFSTLGRLQRGDESMAAILFSQDILFQSHSNPLHEISGTSMAGSSPSASSPISTMFLGEICGSDRARTQLDHSFKRNHGFGITSGEFGPFSLDSLLSDADHQPGAARSSSSPSDLILPLGTLWLWQSLSGCIRMNSGAAEKGVEEASGVVSAVLSLILDLETNQDVASEGDRSSLMASYSATIPVGSKLYYLMNVCLHSEFILREEAVMDTAEAVFDRYWPCLDGLSVLDFKEECLRHTTPSKVKNIRKDDENGDEEEEELDPKDKKLFDLLTQNNDNDSKNKGSRKEWSQEELRTTEAFLEDLATAYNDYGAQYPFFTKCIRVFLSPYFPSSIRLRALREFRGMWHVLTLDSEFQNPVELARVLDRTLLDHDGDIANNNNNNNNSENNNDSIATISKDSSDVLDAMTNLLVEQQADQSSRPLDGFILAFAISLLVRDTVIGILSQQTKTTTTTQHYHQVWRKRLLQLDTTTLSLVCTAVSNFLSSDSSSNNNGGTKEALIKSVLDVTTIHGNKESNMEQSDCQHNNDGGNDIEGQINKLVKRFESLSASSLSI